MITTSHSVTLADNEVTLESIHAQGVGSRRMNKASTAIHLRLNIRASSLLEFYKERLLAARHHSISTDGVVVIRAQEYRNQEMSHEVAVVQLVALVKGLTTVQKNRRETRLIRVPKERRLAFKAQKSPVEALRGRVHQ